MKKINNLIFILSFVSIVHISANSSSPEGIGLNFNLADNSLFSESTKDSLSDGITDQILSQLDAVHGILSDLSAIISDNQIKGITRKQKKNLLSHVKSLMRDIEEKKNSLIVGSHDPEIINFMLHFSRAVIQHVNKALKNQLKEFKKFNSDALIKRTCNAKMLTPKMMHRRIVNNHKRLLQLKNSADSAGLRWYNKAYRKFDRYILQPSNKYGVAIGGAVITTGLLYWLAKNPSNNVVYTDQENEILQRLNQEHQNTRDINRLQQIDRERDFITYQAQRRTENQQPRGFFNRVIGTKPPQTVDTFGIRHNEDNLSWLGWAEVTASKIMHNALPITGFLLSNIWTKYQEEWKLNWQPWLSKKLQSTHYRLMGGAYNAKADKIDNIRAEVTFDDLVGLNHVKSYFKLLVDYLENPESFDRQKLTPQKGCLLVGPTRTGKSFSVAALHGEVKRMLKRNKRDAQFEFIELPAALINREGISILLQIIKYHAPCVVFIDEIDLLNLQRTGKNETLSEFLTSMSGALESTDPKKQVIIIAATNKPENLDVALRQPGRFGKELRFEYPSFKERKEFLKHKLKKLSLNMNNFGIDKLARETDGKSYEGLKALIDHAVLKARLHGQMISQDHLEETLDQEVRRVLLEDIKDVPEHEKELLATHFAGHALALTLLDAHTQLAKVTIKPVMTKIKEELIGKQLWQGAFGKKQSKEQERYEYGSIFTYRKQDTVNMLSYDEKIKLIKANLAGNIAEQILLGSCSYSCHTEDKEKALEMATAITFEGIDPEHLPKHIKKERYNKALDLLATCEKEIKKLLEKYKEALQNIAQELKELGTLSADEVQEIIDDTENQ